MATYDNLPVYKDSYDLLLIVFEVVKKFDKQYKYTLGDKIKNEKSSRDYLEYELKHKKTDLIKLLDEINSKTYKLGNSYSFIAYKPKIREIFAANFRDRIVHHLLIMNLIIILKEICKQCIIIDM